MRFWPIAQKLNMFAHAWNIAGANSVIVEVAWKSKVSELSDYYKRKNK